jgi:hypothetical protein
LREVFLKLRVKGKFYVDDRMRHAAYIADTSATFAIAYCVHSSAGASSPGKNGSKTNLPSKPIGIEVSFTEKPSSPDRSGHAAPMFTHPLPTFARAL